MEQVPKIDPKKQEAVAPAPVEEKANLMELPDGSTATYTNEAERRRILQEFQENK